MTETTKTLIKKDRIKSILKLSDILISHGASLNVLDNDKRTPFALCLSLDHVELMEKLLSDIKINEDPNLLHQFTSKILSEQY